MSHPKVPRIAAVLYQMALSSVPDVELQLRHRYQLLYISQPDDNHIKFEVSLYRTSTISKTCVSTDYLVNLAYYSSLKIIQNCQCSHYLDLMPTIDFKPWRKSFLFNVNIHYAKELRIFNIYALDCSCHRLSSVVEGAYKLECFAKVIYHFFLIISLFFHFSYCSFFQYQECW